MVKLGSGYVNPSHVLAIGSEKNGRGDVQIELGPGVFTVVTGLTVDEVHAKLFPPTPVITDTEAARVVLEWAADPRSAWREEIETLAKKALGR